MAKKKDQKDILDVDVEEQIDKAEKYVEENKRSLTIIIGAIVVIVGGYFFYDNYMGSREAEARDEMFKVEDYFRQDSIDKVINGQGMMYTFGDVIDEFGATESGNLSHAYLGMAYLRQGDFEAAIYELEKFDGDDEIVAPMVEGLIGDAKMEQDDTEGALKHYKNAANMRDNEYTTPYWLMKTGFAYEQLGQYDKAVEAYEKIKYDYPNSSEGIEIDKYIYKAKNNLNG